MSLSISKYITYWLFQKCSCELAGIVTSILNKSISTGTVPSQWLTAVVTPVPKKFSPSELSDYRPISVTPLLPRLAEKIFVQQWLRPSLPMELLKDQYAFNPTGSTCCAMVDFIHHSTLMLQNNSYIRCLFIDFSKAFDVVRHSIKISSLNIPPMALSWIIAFLTGCSQVCKTPDGRFSDPQPITSSVVQGSGIGPTLWLIMESDLYPLSDANVI